jgi:predicted enzyme related to lactoylglutathione lyase
VLAGPMNIGSGRIAVVGDPQGAAFALFEGETDD